MKVQGNFSQLINHKSVHGSAKTSFKGPYVPRNYTGIRELSDLIYENSSGTRKLLMDMYKNSGENLNNMVTAVGTAFVAPVFIAFNPASKEDAKTKAYTSLRQPISAGITLTTQMLVMKNYNKWLDRHAAFLGVDEMDLSAKPPAEVLKPRAKEEYRSYLAECVRDNVEPIGKKKWINARIRELQDDAFYNRLRELRETTTEADVRIEDAVKTSSLESKRRDVLKPVLKNLFNFTDSELEEINSMKDLKKKGKNLIQSKGLEYDVVSEAIDREAMSEAIKDLEAGVEMEANVKHRVTEYLHEMKDTFNRRRLEINSRYSSQQGSSVENSNFIERMDDEIAQMKKSVLVEKLESLRPRYNEIAAKADDAKTAEEHIFEAAYKKLLKAKSIDDIKDHGRTFAEVRKNVLVKRILISKINKAEARLKGWKDRSGILVGLAILPATCGVLNWAYPRIMEKFFPKLSAAKAASKARLYGLQPQDNDKKAKEAK